MARFRFQLEPLLRLRRVEEDRAQKAFQALLRGFRAREAEILELSRKREAAKENLRRSTHGGSEGDEGAGLSADRGLDMEEILRARRYLNVLFQRIEEERGELDRARPPLDAARAALRAAVQNRRSVELLREERYREWVREEGRREQRELDEIGAVSFIRALDGEERAAGGKRP